jgi:RNA polymerase sigma-70 factor (sigma-E family)
VEANTGTFVTIPGPLPSAGDAAHAGDAAAREAVTSLYQAHALGLIRLAVIMVGDRQAAEDVVQEAFWALYRRWDNLADYRKALGYARICVLNGYRSHLRRRGRSRHHGAAVAQAWETVESAESAALVGEEHRQVLAALQKLPSRQREALVLRFYLELPEPEIALAMGISQGTVKSTTSRALAALGRLLTEER